MMRRGEVHKLSQVTNISEAFTSYRNHHGLVSIVPRLIRPTAEPGLESCVDDSPVFHTTFTDPKLDPTKVPERLWADHRPLVSTQLVSGPLKAIEENGST